MIHAYKLNNDVVFSQIGTDGGSYFAFEGGDFQPQMADEKPDDQHGWCFCPNLGNEWDREQAVQFANTVERFNAVAMPDWEFDIDDIVFRGYDGDGGETSLPIYSKSQNVGYIRFYNRTKRFCHHHVSAGWADKAYSGFGDWMKAESRPLPKA